MNRVESLALRSEAMENLTEHEQMLVKDYVLRNPEAMPFSPVLQANLYALFLNGQTCEQIATLNPGMAAGAVLLARVENDWDLRKAEYTNTLLDGVAERAKQIQLESVHFIADLMATVHKKHGAALKRYLQTGNEEELGGSRGFWSHLELRHYKIALEMLKEATGQTDRKTVSGEIVHLHQNAEDGKLDVTDDNAEDLLKFLDKKAKTKALKDKDG